MQEKLTNLWKTCETKQLANIFKKYMESLGVKKWDGRRKDNLNTYMIDGKGTGWNRATCYFYKDCANYADENISIVLRKRSGSYLIIGKRGKRAFEVDYHGVVHYDENLLKEIMEEHKILFDDLLNDENELLQPKETCEWEEDDSGTWSCSKCGASWEFNNGGPSDNDMHYCPKCGREIAKTSCYDEEQG